MSEPQGDHFAPVKERRDPVSCTECGRINWSNQSLCVYCRLGWPDPSELRPVTVHGRSAPAAALEQAPLPGPTLPSKDLSVVRASDGAVYRNVAVDVAGRFVEDVSCVKCRYNLRSLRHIDVCPECGEPVEHSLRVHDLAAADRHWLRTLKNGAWYLVAGPILAGVSPFAAILGGPAGLLILVVGAGLILAGVFCVTSSEPQRVAALDMFERRSALPLLARLTAVSLPLLAFWPVVLYAAWPVRSGVYTSVSLVLLVMSAVCVSATLMVLGDLARRMDNHGYRGQCVALALALPLLLGLIAVDLLFAYAAGVSGMVGLTFCAVVLTIPVGIWTVTLFGCIGMELDRTLRIAEGSLPRQQGDEPWKRSR